MYKLFILFQKNHTENNGVTNSCASCIGCSECVVSSIILVDVVNGQWWNINADLWIFPFIYLGVYFISIFCLKKGILILIIRFNTIIPPTTRKKITLLFMVVPILSSSNERTAWYSPSSSLHTDSMKSSLLVLLQNFLLLVSIGVLSFFINFFQLTDKNDTFLSLKFAWKCAVLPQTASSVPSIRISGPSVNR